MRPPEFWWKKEPSALAALLGPASRVYGWAAKQRLDSARPVSAGVPVICVGNLVVGGAGKTPVAMDIGARLLARGTAMHFLSRGYRGRLRGPLRVDPVKHDFRDVGDEPLMLAGLAPSWISRDRAAGCRAAIADGAITIVMDDGFQNPSVAKDLSLLVVDSRRGFGNGRVIPAGPLREPIAAGLKRADAVVLLGQGGQEIVEPVRSVAGPDFPILRACLEPDCDGKALAGRTVVAFAGIGDPGKFFISLEMLGCRVAETHVFDDHHDYRPSELERILESTKRENAVAVTTAKDAMRVPADVRGSVQVLEIRVEWENEAAIDDLIDKIL